MCHFYDYYRVDAQKCCFILFNKQLLCMSTLNWSNLSKWSRCINSNEHHLIYFVFFPAVCLMLNAMKVQFCNRIAVASLNHGLWLIITEPHSEWIVWDGNKSIITYSTSTVSMVSFVSNRWFNKLLYHKSKRLFLCTATEEFQTIWKLINQPAKAIISISLRFQSFNCWDKIQLELNLVNGSVFCQFAFVFDLYRRSETKKSYYY